MGVRCGKHMADCQDDQCPTHGKARFTIFVYGTLRPGEPGSFQIPGTLYSLGWFPGIKLGGEECGFVTCERIEVTDLEAVDRYEGYDKAWPKDSLYVRKLITAPDGTRGYIYVYNKDVTGAEVIQSGDWLQHTQEQRGRYGNGRFT